MDYHKYVGWNAGFLLENTPDHLLLQKSKAILGMYLQITDRPETSKINLQSPTQNHN